ncbi:hypothetical protein STENM327S_05983 [Streptomyces tendae]
MLWLYKGTGSTSAPFETKSRVGGGWSVYNTLTDTGDLTGDGKADLIARDKSGVLWLYKGTGNAASPFEGRSRVGGGWSAYDVLNGPSDLNRDGVPDLIARDKDGVLWFYQGTGGASAPFKARARVGGGWNTYGMIISEPPAGPRADALGSAACSRTRSRTARPVDRSSGGPLTARDVRLAKAARGAAFGVCAAGTVPLHEPRRTRTHGSTAC